MAHLSFNEERTILDKPKDVFSVLNLGWPEFLSQVLTHYFSHLTNILLYLVFELNVSMQKCCLLITDVSTESENVPLYFRQSFYYPDMENICAIWSHCIYQQIVGITMDTNFTPLIADVFLCSHERDFILNRHKPKQEDLLKTCLTIRGAFRCLCN